MFCHHIHEYTFITKCDVLHIIPTAHPYEVLDNTVKHTYLSTLTLSSGPSMPVVILLEFALAQAVQASSLMLQLSVGEKQTDAMPLIEDEHMRSPHGFAPCE